MKPIFLASKSTRRAHILSQLGLRFKILAPLHQETRLKRANDAKIIETVTANALEKARSLTPSLKNGLIISGDTLVVTKDNEILGKPKSAEDAFKMLQELTGTWHRVISAIAIIDAANGNYRANHIWTRVIFREASTKAIRQYISTQEPQGKAGAYAIQGKGGFFVEQIEGSYTNVIGLPIEILIPLLEEFDVKL
jgi:septum formation protein